MDNKIAPVAASAASSMHPMLWVAAISVTLLSFVGIASFTGLLPVKSQPAPTTLVSTAPAAYAPPAPVAPAATAPEAPATAAIPEAAPAAAPAATPPATQHKVTKKKPVVHNVPPQPTHTPPLLGAGTPPDYAPPPPAASIPAPCANCGVITAIKQVAREGEGSGLGAIAGGILGGVLGNNVGNGNGRTLATIAGAVGGGFLGNKVEKSRNESTTYQISVRLEDGSSQMVESATTPPWRTGDEVRLVNGAITSR